MIGGMVVQVKASDNLQEEWDDAVKAHTLTGSFTLASGAISDTYIDIIGLSMCSSREHVRGSTCQFVMDDYIDALESSIPKAIKKNTYYLMFTGRWGAMMTASDTFYSDKAVMVLWTPPGHGVEWRYSKTTRSKAKNIILVDDVRTTGATLAAMAVAAESEGYKVVGEFALVDRSVNEDNV